MRRAPPFGRGDLLGLILASSIAALLASCGKARAPGFAPGKGAGPEIRVRVARAPVVRIGFDHPVDVRSLASGDVLFRGDLPPAIDVRVEGPSIRIGTTLFSEAVRIEPRTTAGSQGGAPEREASAAPASTATWPRDIPPAPDDGAPTFLVALQTHGSASSPSASSPTGGSGAGSSDPAETAVSVARYRGALELWASSGPSGAEIVAVNALPIEHYLLGVVACEMPAEYPEASVRSQAIASRSYALYEVDLARERGRDRVFSAGPDFQVYRGVAGEHPRARAAVEATWGKVLTYEGRLFRAYFHSTCGGQTARASLAFGESDIPPLEGRPCGACDGAPRARWDAIIPLESVERALRERIDLRAPGTPIGAVENVEVAEVGPDARVRYVRIDHSLGSVEWRADVFRSRVAPSQIHSTCFRIRAGSSPGEIVVSGRGWGHGVGMCQIGASNLAREGLDYPEILGRYYPHAELRSAW